MTICNARKKETHTAQFTLMVVLMMIVKKKDYSNCPKCTYNITVYTPPSLSLFPYPGQYRPLPCYVVFFCKHLSCSCIIRHSAHIHVMYIERYTVVNNRFKVFVTSKKQRRDSSLQGHTPQKGGRSSV